MWTVCTARSRARGQCVEYPQSESGKDGYGQGARECRGGHGFRVRSAEFQVDLLINVRIQDVEDGARSFMYMISIKRSWMSTRVSGGVFPDQCRE